MWVCVGILIEFEIPLFPVIIVHTQKKITARSRPDNREIRIKGGRIREVELYLWLDLTCDHGLWLDMTGVEMTCDLTWTWAMANWLGTWLDLPYGQKTCDLIWTCNKWLETWIGTCSKWLVTWLGLANNWLAYISAMEYQEVCICIKGNLECW